MKPTLKFFRKLILRLSAAALLVFVLVLGFYGIKGYQMYRNAVAEKNLEERVEEIRGAENFTAYSQMPQFYIEATISTEDHRFEQHCGIDPIAICRAAWTDLKAMAFVEGGSTITQQLAKNMLFTQEKKIERKAAEVFAALKIESKYTKQEIFELYANTVYFGSGYYGIYEASMGYFGKEPMELTDYECAMLAGIPNAPSIYSPDVNKDFASKRTEQVLDCMVKNKVISRKEAEGHID
ncbi:MAG: transglycosylase domain-containing protein [Lachnospiraceae bacterium]|nr:transglycosylase domain-containing protein [Lachnospiraceae bacterium]